MYQQNSPPFLTQKGEKGHTSLVIALLPSVLRSRKQSGITVRLAITELLL